MLCTVRRMEKGKRASKGKGGGKAVRTSVWVVCHGRLRVRISMAGLWLRLLLLAAMSSDSLGSLFWRRKPNPDC